jgi:hypothetical protein
MDDQNQMYSYTLPPPQIPNTSISDDDLIQEISSVQSSDLLSGGNNISTTNDRRAYARLPTNNDTKNTDEESIL